MTNPVMDTVHGAFELPHVAWQLCDSGPLQRLRYLQQLGCTSYVFPGATHTRHAHSLGVCHSASTFAKKLMKEQGPSLDMTDRDVLCVTLAGLCHDLGHGPFSHAWDRFLKAKHQEKWQHEVMSGELLDHIVDEQHIDLISQDDTRLIKQLITGKPTASQEKVWLFDIVANGRAGVDVDKMDYLPRDAHHCGVNVRCDLSQLIPSARVINNEVCFAATQLPHVRSLFETRAVMHETVYTNTHAKAVELMVMEALLLADPVLRMSEKMHKCDTFISLDDTLLRLIETYDVHLPQLDDEDGSACLKPAQDIIKRLRHRQLYRFVHQVTIPGEVMSHMQVPNSADICAHGHANGQVNLDPDQVCIDVARIDWSMQLANPMTHMKWYTHRDELVGTEQLTGMLPASFQEHKLRVYSKLADPKVEDALAAALDSYHKMVVATSSLQPSQLNHNANGSTRDITPSPTRDTRPLDVDTPLKRCKR